MKLWKLVRNSCGYEEPEALILAAESEDQARMWAVRHHRNASWVADWLFPEESNCVQIGSALEIFTDGEIVLVSVSAS